VGSVGIFGICRFVIELFPGEWLHFGPALGAVGLGSALWATLRLLRSNSYRANMTTYCALLQGYVLLGLSSGQHWGVLGAWTLLCYSSYAFTAYVVLLVYAEKQGDEPGPAYAANNPVPGLAYVLCVTAISCLPISAGFYGVIFIFWGTALSNKALFYLSLLTLPPMLFVLSKNLIPALAKEQLNKAWSMRVWSRFEHALIFPLLLFLLLLGVFPNWLVASALPTVGYFLKVLGRV
jgi:NADH:ubiquinone oxidoreductase subunit 4 (subunit M)